MELLAVDKSAQGEGIATDLMAFAENVAQVYNAYRILL
ncbi:MAG: GNAT family N-acetyltransferase [Thermoplasmataceae archaeon]